MLVAYDPQQVGYEELLEIFWASHDPTSPVYSRQYRNAVFYRTEEQRRAALASLEAIREQHNAPVTTAIESAGRFYPAEDYHQKYYLQKHDRLFSELQRHYPDFSELVASTAAARLNGYLGCHGRREDLQRELGRLGLSAAAQNTLVEYVTTACRGFSGLTCPAPPSP